MGILDSFKARKALMTQQKGNTAEAKKMLLHSLLPTGKPIVSAIGLCCPTACCCCARAGKKIT